LPYHKGRALVAGLHADAVRRRTRQQKPQRARNKAAVGALAEAYPSQKF
jgi:hypothetical protein